MGRQYLVLLDEKPYYCCSDCNTHLALRKDLVSEAFRGRTGTAWLFNTVTNVYTSHVEDRMMTTGLHTIADIFCKMCHTNLGWKYEYAFEQAQKYKQGKYILERDLVRLVDDETESDSGDQNDGVFGTVRRHSRNGGRDTEAEVGTLHSTGQARRRRATLSLSHDVSELQSKEKRDDTLRIRPLTVLDSSVDTKRRHVGRLNSYEMYCYSHFFPLDSYDSHHQQYQCTPLAASHEPLLTDRRTSCIPLARQLQNRLPKENGFNAATPFTIAVSLAQEDGKGGAASGPLPIPAESTQQESLCPSTPINGAESLQCVAQDDVLGGSDKAAFNSEKSAASTNPLTFEPSVCESAGAPAIAVTQMRHMTPNSEQNGLSEVAQNHQKTCAAKDTETHPSAKATGPAFITVVVSLKSPT